MDYIGIDVHKTSSQVCSSEDGSSYRERRIRTTREALTNEFAGREHLRLLLEASTESEWVAQHLESMGHDVVVADPNFAPMYATRTRAVKTDRRDARALCDACRLGAYRAAHRPPPERRHERAELRVREALVFTRSKYISLIGALVRREGYRIPPGSADRFLDRLRSMELPNHLLEELAPLARAIELFNDEIEIAEVELKRRLKEQPTVANLATVPGVGPVTAATFVAVVDQVERFSSARAVRSYLGLVPREYSSGERQQRGHITKAGNTRMRSLLVEAAWSFLRSKRPEAIPLKTWAERIAARRGKRIAVVALARKLAGVLFAMWRDRTPFSEPHPHQPLEVNVAA